MEEPGLPAEVLAGPLDGVAEGRRAGADRHV